MIKFIVKRLVALIPVLLGVTLLVFFILDLAPGDPAKTILGEQGILQVLMLCLLCLRFWIGNNESVVVLIK